MRQAVYSARAAIAPPEPSTSTAVPNSSSTQTVRIVSGTDNRRGGGIVSTAVIVTSVALPLAACAYGYRILRLTGWSVADLLYVTRRSFNDAMESVHRKADHLTERINTTRRELLQQVRGVKAQTDELVSVQSKVAERVEQSRATAELSRQEAASSRRETVAVQSRLDELQNQLQQQMDELCTKQDQTNRGILLLCRFVYKHYLNEHSDTLERIRAFAELPSPPNTHRRTAVADGFRSLVGLFDSSSSATQANMLTGTAFSPNTTTSSSNHRTNDSNQGTSTLMHVSSDDNTAKCHTRSASAPPADVLFSPVQSRECSV